MSTSVRIISGSLASWVRIGVSMLSQMALVPLYLVNWSPDIYGIWLAIQSLIVILSSLDKSYQNYIGYEFLRIGKDNRTDLRKYLWSATFVGVVLGVFQIIIILVIVNAGYLTNILGERKLSVNISIDDVGVVLLFQSAAWLISGSIGGIIGRILSVFGYYPRMSWWGVFAAIITSIAPVLTVMSGGDLLLTGKVAALATVLYNIPLYIDMFLLLKKEHILFTMPSLKLGYTTFSSSLVLAGKDFLESMRQQGVRLILAPLVGSAGLAAFSTMRTGSNIALQGLGTVTNPLMPELMRFLHKKDQQKMEASFGTVWMVLISLMAPAVVIFQAIAPGLFKIWVQGKIGFNPILFALLSISVLVYAQAQPAMAVMKGNNLLRPQLLIAVVTILTLLSSLYFLVPRFGLHAAGFSLLLSELLATQGYKIVAKNWLSKNKLAWPKKASIIAGNSVWLSALAMTLMISFKELTWIIVGASMIMFVINAYLYLLVLPELVRHKIRSYAGKFPILNKFLSSSN